MTESSEASPKPPPADPIAGEFVTETFDYDRGRQVTVYVPPDQPKAIVFAGDGQMISQWGGVLEGAAVPSTMIVGVHRVADETLRLQEYSPGFDPERFAAPERFFVEDVGAWVHSRFGVTLSAERTAVCGVSASGELEAVPAERRQMRWTSDLNSRRLPRGCVRPSAWPLATSALSDQSPVAYRWNNSEFIGPRCGSRSIRCVVRLLRYPIGATEGQWPHDVYNNESNEQVGTLNDGCGHRRGTRPGR